MNSCATLIKEIKFENLVFSHDGGELLFENVDFQFPMNQIVWVRASGGAGRSSLLQLMAGLQLPLRGKYLINDENVAEMSFEEFLPYRLSIGYGFDFGGLINNQSLLENVTLPLLYHKILSPKEALVRAETYFEKLGITKYAHKRPALVPGGMRKLTCLVRALVTHPQLLLLDDPTVGLGQETALKYFDLIHELRGEGFLSHVFLSSFDERMMGLLEHTEIFVDCGQIYAEVDMIDQKKVVHL